MQRSNLTAAFGGASLALRLSSVAVCLLLGGACSAEDPELGSGGTTEGEQDSELTEAWPHAGQASSPSPSLQPSPDLDGRSSAAVEAPVEASPSEDPLPTKSEIELAFVGDVIFGRYRGEDYDPIVPEGVVAGAPFQELSALWRDSDLAILNLETPVTRELPVRSPVLSRYRFAADAGQIGHLSAAGFDLVNLANNHAFDLGAEGAQETPQLLREAGVDYVGAARSDEPGPRVETRVVGGLRIAFVSVTARRNRPDFEEGPYLPFLSTSELRTDLPPLLEAARPEHDLIVVMVHWGDEYADRPNPNQVRAARAMVAAGADLIIGHHPHVLQGAVRMEAGGRRALVAYSLGNFLFENSKEQPRLSGVLRVRVQAPQGTRPACLRDADFTPAYMGMHPYPRPRKTKGWMAKKTRQRFGLLSNERGTLWFRQDEGPGLELRHISCPR